MRPSVGPSIVPEPPQPSALPIGYPGAEAAVQPPETEIVHSPEMTAVRVTPQPSRARRPRLGFAGVGWIGRNRLLAVQESDVAEVFAIADPVEQQRDAARQITPGAVAVASVDELLELPLDGVVIATPSALHAEQARAALDRGLAVFCQKPLGRTAAEAHAVVDAARAANRLLGVDFSYRHTAAARELRACMSSAERSIGPVHAADLVFHNAYGPDKAWFYDRALAGGGCLMDLGIHLVDLALWLLDFPEVVDVHGRLMAGGKPLDAGDSRPGSRVEDYAAAQLELATGAVVQLRCSWRLPAGRDAIIEAAFYGAHGGLALRNVNGSFYDFVAERYTGTRSTVLAEPPDAWGGRATVAWARALAAGARFDPAAEEIVTVAEILDRIYACAGATPERLHA
jgi:predicted dehydrogenase